MNGKKENLTLKELKQKKETLEKDLEKIDNCIEREEREEDREYFRKIDAENMGFDYEDTSDIEGHKYYRLFNPLDKNRIMNEKIENLTLDELREKKKILEKDLETVRRELEKRCFKFTLLKKNKK